jgi:hypothetical protein
MELRAIKLKQIIIGWVNYFKLADMKSTLKKLDEWLRRRVRLCYWKQWKKIKTEHDNLKRLVLMNIKLGSMRIQEKVTGGYPTALFYPEHYLINILKSKVL